MAALSLSPSQRREKRADAQRLEPVVAVGGDGLTAAVVKEADTALNAHGLIKLRVHNDDRAEREAMFARLAEALRAAPVQHIGKTLVLWRPAAPREALAPDDRLPGPRLVTIVKFSKSGNHRPQIKKIKVLGNQRVAAGGAIKRVRRRKSSPKKLLSAQ